MYSAGVILHPTDFSPSAEKAFRLAETLAGSLHRRLVVLHVHSLHGRAVVFGKARVQVRRGGDQDPILEALRSQAPLDSRVAVEHQLEEGDVATAILRVAQEARAEYIVMGSRGRTGLERLALGSVADQVLCEARCPVVTVSVPTNPDTVAAGAPGMQCAPWRASSRVPTPSATDRGYHDTRRRSSPPTGTTGDATAEPIGTAKSVTCVWTFAPKAWFCGAGPRRTMQSN